MDSITLLECFLTATVVVTQVRCFLTTKNHCSTLAAVFPDYEPVAEIKESYAPEATEHSIEVRRRVEPSGPVSQSFTKILAATNSYLDKNFGAPADFRILDGIAERVSAAVEQ